MGKETRKPMTKEEKELYQKQQEKNRIELENQILSFAKNPEIWEDEEFTKFMSRFYQYSARNTMLIYQQNPYAMLCGSLLTFNKMGYRIKKGQKAMKVLVPITVKKCKIREDKWLSYNKLSKAQKELVDAGKIQYIEYNKYKAGNVFDISQTDCPKEDYPKLVDIGYASEKHANLFTILKDYCENTLNCKVVEDAYCSIKTRGWFDTEKNVIAISDNFDDSTKLSILTHEMGHAILHNLKTLSKLDKPLCQIEFEADCVSILLQSNFGVEIPSSRRSHLKDIHTTLLTYEIINPDFNSDRELLNSFSVAQAAFKDVMVHVKDGIEELSLAEEKDDKENNEKKEKQKKKGGSEHEH